MIAQAPATITAQEHRILIRLVQDDLKFHRGILARTSSRDKQRWVGNRVRRLVNLAIKLNKEGT